MSQIELGITPDAIIAPINHSVLPLMGEQGANIVLRAFQALGISTYHQCNGDTTRRRANGEAITYDEFIDGLTQAGAVLTSDGTVPTGGSSNTSAKYVADGLSIIIDQVSGLAEPTGCDVLGGLMWTFIGVPGADGLGSWGDPNATQPFEPAFPSRWVYKSNGALFYGPAVVAGDIGEIRVTPTAREYYVNDNLIFARPRTVQFEVTTNPGGAGSMDSSGGAVGNIIPANQTDSFIATAPGTYVVTATFDDGQQITREIIINMNPITDLNNAGQPAAGQIRQGECFEWTVIGGAIHTAYTVTVRKASDDSDVTAQFDSSKSGTPIQGELCAQCDTPAGLYKLHVVHNASSEFSDHFFTVIANDPIEIVGNPPAGYVGGSYQLTGGPAGAVYKSKLGAAADVVLVDGIFEPTTPGDYILKYETVQGCIYEIDLTAQVGIENFRVYSAMEVVPSNEDEGSEECVKVSQGDSVQIVVSGGSGQNEYRISGGNLVSQNGLVQVTGTDSFTLLVRDTISGQEVLINFCVEFNSACVAPVEAEVYEEEIEPCCDVVMECGDGAQTLAAPSFLIDQPQNEINNQIPQLVGNGVNVNAQFAELNSTNANSTAQVLPCAPSGSSFFFRVVSQLSLVTGTSEIRFVYKGTDTNVSTALVFFTDGGVRKVRVENSGVEEAGSEFNVVSGREFAYGYNASTGKFELYQNNVKVFTSADAPGNCGQLCLTIEFAEANQAIGGSVKFDQLINTTNLGGTLIQSENKYEPPAEGFNGVEIIEAVMGEYAKKVNIRVVRPLLRRMSKHAFQFAATANIYIGTLRQTLDAIRLTRSGVPDANQNAGMEWVGKTKAGATVTFSSETKREKDDDGGVIKWATDAMAKLEYEMLAVNDLEKVSKVSNNVLKRIPGTEHYGIGLPDCNDPFRVLIVFRIGGNQSNTYRVIELNSAYSESELAFTISKQGDRSAMKVTIEGTVDDSKPSIQSIGTIWNVPDCRYSNSQPVCSVG